MGPNIAEKAARASSLALAPRPNSRSAGARNPAGSYSATVSPTEPLISFSSSSRAASASAPVPCRSAAGSLSKIPAATQGASTVESGWRMILIDMMRARSFKECGRRPR